MQEKCLTGERTAEADENGEMVGNVRKICRLSLILGRFMKQLLRKN